MRPCGRNVKDAAMENGYLGLKTLHIMGAVLFLGNLIVTGWWKAMADRTRDARIVAFAQRQVTLTDRVFTLGGALLVLLTGQLNASLHGISYAGNPWLSWGLGLFTLSGAVWVAILIPIQVRQGRMARGFAGGGPIPDEYWRLCRLWYLWGVIATALPLGVVSVMVFKGAAA
jgi:uncharacterized membrane protein